MSTLVVARRKQLIDAVLVVLRGDGFDAAGTTDDNEALTLLEAGGVTALVIGGGVEQAARATLMQAGAACGATVIEGALAGRDVETYVREDIEPRLRNAAEPA